MSTANIIPYVNAFVKSIQAVPIRFKVENLPAIGKSFMTIPTGSGAIKLEIVKRAALCVHIYSSQEVIRRDSNPDFQLKNRVYTSTLLTKSENIRELLTALAALLPEAVHHSSPTPGIKPILLQIPGMQHINL